MNGTAATDGVVIVSGAADGFAQEIVAGGHRFRSDEPRSAGGTDSGPTPYDLLTLRIEMAPMVSSEVRPGAGPFPSPAAPTISPGRGSNQRSLPTRRLPRAARRARLRAAKSDPASFPLGAMPELRVSENIRYPRLLKPPPMRRFADAGVRARALCAPLSCRPCRRPCAGQRRTPPGSPGEARHAHGCRCVHA